MSDTSVSNRDSSAYAQKTPKIVVGVDGSETSIQALREGARLSSERGAALVAVCTWHLPASYGTVPDNWKPEHDAEGILNDAALRAFGDNPPPRYTQLVREGSPARVLVDESLNADMLIVGSRGHGGFKGLLLGSVSQACAEYAKCPVLILHADDAHHLQ